MHVTVLVTNINLAAYDSTRNLLTKLHYSYTGFSFIAKQLWQIKKNMSFCCWGFFCFVLFSKHTAFFTYSLTV